VLTEAEAHPFPDGHPDRRAPVEVKVTDDDLNAIDLHVSGVGLLREVAHLSL
jgi:hypothetical protein